MSVKLYAVESENKSAPQLAHEAVKEYRSRQEQHGLIVGERYWHRVWPEGIVLFFLQAQVIKPTIRLTQAVIDGR